MLYSVSHLFRRPSERERETVSFSNEYIGSCLLHLKLLSALPKTAYYPVRYIAMARERERESNSVNKRCTTRPENLASTVSHC